MHSKFNFNIMKRNENILENAYNLIKKYLRNFIHTNIYPGLLSCLLPRSQIRLTDGCGFWGTYTHTSPHLTSAELSWSSCTWHASSTWPDIRCHLRDMSLFPFYTFCLLICLFVCRVCLLISQLGVRLSDSPRMVNRRNSPAKQEIRMGKQLEFELKLKLGL